MKKELVTCFFFNERPLKMLKNPDIETTSK